MHSVLNGRADTVGPAIQLGDFFPERREVVINGSSHLAWVTTNRRYPRPIQAQLDRYRNKYLAASDSVLNPKPVDAETEAKLSDEERLQLLTDRATALDSADEAYEEFLTNALMALVPSLDQSTVELVNRETIEQVLRDLGYFSVPDVDQQVVEQMEAANTGESAPLTGAISTPDSVTSSQPIQPNSS